MPIEPISGSLAQPASVRLRRRQTGFSVPDAAECASSDTPAETQAAAQLPLLTLQAAELPQADASTDREAARQGECLLGAMRRLQLAMLGGTATPHELEALSRGLPDALDPGLNDVLRAIAQRAAVERARRA